MSALGGEAPQGTQSASLLCVLPTILQVLSCTGPLVLEVLPVPSARAQLRSPKRASHIVVLWTNCLLAVSGLLQEVVYTALVPSRVGWV